MKSLPDKSFTKGKKKEKQSKGRSRKRADSKMRKKIDCYVMLSLLKSNRTMTLMRFQYIRETSLQ